jgi:hypothetical protein
MATTETLTEGPNVGSGELVGAGRRVRRRRQPG